MVVSVVDGFSQLSVPASKTCKYVAGKQWLEAKCGVMGADPQSRDHVTVSGNPNLLDREPTSRVQRCSGQEA